MISNSFQYLPRSVVIGRKLCEGRQSAGSWSHEK